MQKTTLIVLSSLCLVLSAGSAEARSSKKTANNNNTNTVTSERVETHQAAPEHHSGVTFDLGLSSIFPVASSGAANGSLTGILHLTSLDAIQILLGISTTNGGFGFGIGGIYKRTVLGNESAGLHLGGGLGLGTVAGAGGAAAGSSTSFAMNIVAVIGAHFDIPGTQLAFHFDGGPAFSLVSVSGTNGIGGSTVTSFAMQPLSSLLGASVVYAF